jgi:hypothetical protein
VSKIDALVVTQKMSPSEIAAEPRNLVAVPRLGRPLKFRS